LHVTLNTINRGSKDPESADLDKAEDVTMLQISGKIDIGDLNSQTHP